MQALQASPQLQDLAAAVSAVCSECNCTGAANIAWAQATLQLPDSPLILQVLKLCTSTDLQNRTYRHTISKSQNEHSALSVSVV